MYKSRITRRRTFALRTVATSKIYIFNILYLFDINFNRKILNALTRTIVVAIEVKNICGISLRLDYPYEREISLTYPSLPFRSFIFGDPAERKGEADTGKGGGEEGESCLSGPLFFSGGLQVCGEINI